jgi:F0F1-type ATP synthase membrane subunit c/vacuolar-type H+-ATPase subunit K
MNCTEITPLLPEYIRRRLPTAEEAAVRAHLSACPACAAAYEDELAFGSLMHGTDAPAPAHLMARVMAGVRAEPRQAPTFRIRPLDFVLAIAAAAMLYGLGVGLLALREISPVITGIFDPSALLADGLTVRALTLGALWAVVGLAISIPIAAAMHAALRNRRPTITRQSSLF